MCFGLKESRSQVGAGNDRLQLTIEAPVTNDASSLTRKAATAATSAGWPLRPIACSLSAKARAAGSAKYAAFIGVSIQPGQMQLTRIPSAR